MKTVSCPVFLVLFTVSTLCRGQIDIYQSDAYSVEEMCAREAEQNTETDYTSAYESCIENNREKPMYQSIRNGIDTSDDPYTEGADPTENPGQSEAGQESY